MDLALLRPSRSKALQMATLRKSNSSHFETSLVDLPPDALRTILRRLTACELAALCVQVCCPVVKPPQTAQLHEVIEADTCEADSVRGLTQNRYLRQVASAAELWRPLCESSWPRTRAGMPPMFSHSVDRLAALQQLAARRDGTNPSFLFGETMQVLVEAQLAVSRCQERVAGSPEQRRVWSSVGWWLHSSPEVAIRFVRDTNAMVTTELVAHGHARDLDSYVQAQLPWRRSAIAFLGGVLRRCESVHPSIREALVTETIKLDRTIRSITHDPWAAAPAPAGLPDSHWWYRPRCKAFG